ncbi:hypothetical protein [Paraburkholderia sp. GAS32]|uniref:hypothetical protein n=1 Tax=Paraburkholderia sp. GAS32 TaxID=3035129 RepID=UPI003D1DC99E
MQPPKELIEYANRVTLHNPDLQIVSQSEDYPWFIREFQRQLQVLEARKELLLPNLRDNNESVAIFSDYGGESSDSKYNTYSFLICAWNQLALFHREMDKLRLEAGLSNPLKEISFKDFRYGPIKRSLDKYLSNLSNLVNGYLLTVVVEKTVGSVYGTDRKATHKFITKTLAENGFGDWKYDVAEKMMRITHFSAYLAAFLSGPGQKIFWMTDHDSIASTGEKFQSALSLFDRLLRHYSKHEFSLVGGAVPFEEKSPQFLDLLSAPDIVAGSVEHYLTRAYGGNEEPLVKEGADKVLGWLTGQGIGLKRHTMIIRTQDNGIVGGTLKFDLKETDPNAIFVPILMA